MRPELQALAFLGVNPAQLDPAPAGPLRTTGYQARIHPLSPTRARCAACGEPAIATQIVDVPGLGLRWHDSCRDCMVAGAKLERP
ncbi:hypothetical protein [Streptomyces sp. NRRL S-813]|uniref:hypothetical protein n=1 Tax=Streptomyces sp. NRRL S-813 TaxID=1463919 RepID=UPI0004C21D2E|nr:hypothetical protein [Streptomyces sp. NRRL S-813]